ncbi:hypothetical protein BJX64DRAFT_29414 [Aspergillus heterothallicus]
MDSLRGSTPSHCHSRKVKAVLLPAQSMTSSHRFNTRSEPSTCSAPMARGARWSKSSAWVLSIRPSQRLAINVLVKADLSHLVDSRRGNLHWVMQPDKEHRLFGWRGILRVMKPWSKWMFMVFHTRDCEINIEPSREEYSQRIRDLPLWINTMDGPRERIRPLFC